MRAPALATRMPVYAPSTASHPGLGSSGTISRPSPKTCTSARYRCTKSPPQSPPGCLNSTSRRSSRGRRMTCSSHSRTVNGSRPSARRFEVIEGARTFSMVDSPDRLADQLSTVAHCARSRVPVWARSSRGTAFVARGRVPAVTTPSTTGTNEGEALASATGAGSNSWPQASPAAEPALRAGRRRSPASAFRKCWALPPPTKNGPTSSSRDVTQLNHEGASYSTAYSMSHAFTNLSGFGSRGTERF